MFYSIIFNLTFKFFFYVVEYYNISFKPSILSIVQLDNTIALPIITEFEREVTVRMLGKERERERKV